MAFQFLHRWISSLEDATVNFEQLESLFQAPGAQLPFLQLLSPQNLQVQQGATTVTAGAGVNSFDVTLPAAWPTNHYLFIVGLDPQTTNVAGNYTIGSRTNGLTKGRFQFGSSQVQNWGVEWFSLGN